MTTGLDGLLDIRNQNVMLNALIFLVDGYNQIKMDPEHMTKTAFTRPGLAFNDCQCPKRGKN